LVGFTGDHCGTDIDYCVNITCSNGGSCVDGINNFSCNCKAGYTGDHCQAVLPTPIVSTDKTTTYISAITTHPTTEQPETELVIELRMQRTWDNQLEDKNSKAFKLLSDLLEKEIRKHYSQDENFLGVKTILFKPGSVMVEFKLFFKTKVEDNEALAPLRKGLEDGSMGSLNVYPESLKIVKVDEEPTKEGREKVSLPLVIGVSCGGAFVLTLIAIFLVRYCQQMTKFKNRGSGDTMPTEVAFPSPEKYELQEIELKEECALYGMSGFSGEPVPTEEVGIQNAAADYN